MFANPQVPLERLVLPLSQAVDDVDPCVAQHQQRVAYISMVIAGHMGFKGETLPDLFLAAAFHDIGLIGVENRVSAAGPNHLQQVLWHPEVGFQLVKDNELLSGAAELIRYHHVPWANGKGAEQDGRPVPSGARVLFLADAIEREIARGIPVLAQAEPIAEKVASLSGEVFHPDCVEAFQDIAQTEAFWLDTVNGKACDVLARQRGCRTPTVGESGLASIAETFARVVDLASPWTAVHSAGVAASALAIAKRFGFSPRELHMMRTAAYLHDLGKLVVPTSILDKPGGLTVKEMAIVREHAYRTFDTLRGIGGADQISEWAAFHHERLDGSGYPFHLTGQDLSLGSRIMAVADTFSAISEDRASRAGMVSSEALTVLRRFVKSGDLDGDVVAVLECDYEAVYAGWRQEAAEYWRKQQRLLSLTGKLQATRAG